MPSQHPPHSSAPLAELGFLLLLATLWGASYTLIKLGVESIPPVTLIAVRTTIASVVLLGVLRYRRLAMPVDLAIWRRFFAQAWLNSVIPFTLIAWAERSVDAGLATMLNSLAPVFAFVLASFGARRHGAPRHQLFGVASGMIGVVLIVGVQALAGLGGQLMAQLAIVVATLCYAGAAIFGRNFRGLDPMLPATGSLVCGAIVLVPLSLVVDRPWTLAPSERSVAALLGLSIFSTALAFTLYFRLIQTLGSVAATSQAYLRVPIGVAIGAAFLGETLEPTELTGLVLIIAGVAAMTIPAQRRAESNDRNATPLR